MCKVIEVKIKLSEAIQFEVPQEMESLEDSHITSSDNKHTKSIPASTKKIKPQVRFLVGSEHPALVARKPLATCATVLHTAAIEEGTEKRNQDEDWKGNGVEVLNETPSTIKMTSNTEGAPMKGTVRSSMTHKTLVIQKVMRDKNENLRMLGKEQDELRNEVAIAQHTIMELRARLVKANHSLNNTRSFEEGLRFEAEKLKHERERLSHRCRNAIWETESRLRVKDEKIIERQAEIDKNLKLCEEARKRNQVLRERLEKREKVALGLKAKFTLMTNWTVRQ